MAIRVIAAAMLIILYVLNTITGWAGTIVLILAGILLLTGITGLCPLYNLFHINTRRNKKAEH